MRRAISTALLLLVALFGFLTLNRVKLKAFQIVGDTLPGLSDAGVANADVADDFNHLMLALMATTPQERAGLRAKAEAFEAEAAKSLQAYNDSIFEDEDRRNFQAVMQRRREYLAARQQVIELMNRSADKEALAHYKQALLPSYDRYMAAGKVILDYNARQGSARGRSIMKFSLLTQFSVAAFTVALFVLGFAVGIFKYDPIPHRPRSVTKPMPIV